MDRTTSATLNGGKHRDRRDHCKRPHCLYKHDKDDRGMFDNTLHGSPVTTAGVWKTHSTSINGVPQVNEAKDPCLLELERINKEIETVKNEVEKEQRRLSRYQTVQVDSERTGSKKVLIAKSETPGKDLNGNSVKSKHRQSTTVYSPARRKYVVDNSKPRTDLEYDPLSNFSASLRSSGCSEYKPGNEQKVRSGQGVKRTRENVCKEDQTKPPFQEFTASPASSNKLVDDSEEEEGVLIIDIPPLESDRKKCRAQKPCKINTNQSQEIKEEVHPVFVPTVAHAPLSIPLPVSTPGPEVVEVLSPPAVSEIVKDDNLNTYGLSSVSASRGNDGEPSAESVFDDLSKCLENLRSESERIVCYQEAEVTAESNCVPEPVTLKMSLSSLQTRHHNEPVKTDVNLLMAEPGLLERELAYNCVENSNHLQPNEVSYGHISSLPHNVLVPPSIYSPHKLPIETQRSEQPVAQSSAQSYWSPVQSVSSVPCLQKIPGQTPALDFSLPSPVPGANFVEQAATTVGFTQCQLLYGPTASGTNGVELQSAPLEQPTVEAMNEHIVIDSNSEELEYSELSDSDTMEECYRIFMEEANKGEEGSTDQACTPVGAVDVETPGLAVKPKPLPGPRKRVAHVSRYTEPPVGKSKAQVIVPFRGGAPQLSNPSKIQQLQQRASVLSAALKGGQAFISNSQRKMVMLPSPAHQATHHPVQYLIHQPTHQTTMQNSCVNVIPVGTAIQVGNNLHFILPEGSYTLPITPANSPVTPVHTPVHTPVTPVPVQPQPTAYIPAKPIPTKRKAKMRPEVSAKVPHDVRQRYVNLFVEEFLKTSVTVQDAFEKALAEEKTVYDRSINKLKYLSVAVNALKRLKNQSSVSVKAGNETNVQLSKGNIPLNEKALWGNGDVALYDSLKEHILSEEILMENNYPLQHPEKSGSAILYREDYKKGITDREYALKRICCRCGATYSVNQVGKHTRKEECNYHYGKGVEKKVPGGVETRYSCCEGVAGCPGCQVFKLHVHDAVSLDGFVSTLPRPASDKGCPGVFSVDCEMCYTTQGLELARVTVVNSSLQVIYDTFVKPDNDVIDYNTRFSGINEADVKGTSSSIRDVQETLLSFVSAETILIGYGLESDLCALKLLHGTVVDTSVSFPHRLGLPHKMTLHNLTADYLRRIIQESGGSNTNKSGSGEDVHLLCVIKVFFFFYTVKLILVKSGRHVA
ncbi:RNA exonuclease 1 homolog isoform X5 [Oncorhynchus tshawytscha]|uniref:RNA exonuclease 1 homolog isoform X5 n=1 Tax=Oncorhynchus tshawytscha TaxID=74940 RepID=UPI000D0A2726|nr:RNA exonuclease 1 homolog isoform X5 [Oncorhynchus tshawytscha]